MIVYGYHYIFRFENNYGASVIKWYGTYGFEQDLFELAVILWDGDEYDVSYNTEIANDVIGNLTRYEVMGLLRRIKDL